MNVTNWITILSMLLFWIGSIIIFWNNINVQMKEIEMKIKNTEDDMASLEKWALRTQKHYDEKFAEIQSESKEDNKELNRKLDILIENLNDFKVDFEKRIK